MGPKAFADLYVMRSLFTCVSVFPIPPILSAAFPASCLVYLPATLSASIMSVCLPPCPSRTETNGHRGDESPVCKKAKNNILGFEENVGVEWKEDWRGGQGSVYMRSQCMFVLFFQMSNAWVLKAPATTKDPLWWIFFSTCFCSVFLMMEDRY